jgi:hypothetical protein
MNWVHGNVFFFFFGLLKNNLADLELCDVLYKGSITVLDFILYSF